MNRLISASLGATCSGSSASSSNSWNLSLINIYHDCGCEHTGFTCVRFAFSNLFRADLPPRCIVAVVCWLFLQARHCLWLWVLHQGFVLPWPRTRSYGNTAMEQRPEGVLRPHKCAAGLTLLPGEETDSGPMWGSRTPCFFQACDLRKSPTVLFNILCKNCLLCTSSQSQSHCGMMPNV